jgi:hypothetical protein
VLKACGEVDKELLPQAGAFKIDRNTKWQTPNEQAVKALDGIEHIPFAGLVSGFFEPSCSGVSPVDDIMLRCNHLRLDFPNKASPHVRYQLGRLSERMD